MKNSVNRADLAKTVALVRPALAAQPYIPALTHVMFSAGYALAYNDISCISVKTDIDIDRCVPGEMLAKAMASFAAETVAMQYDEKTSTLLMSSGRSKIKLPTLPVKDFPFEVPTEQGAEITVTDDIIKGIERCLMSVGTDPTHPAQMGVTLDMDDTGNAVLFSTDDYTISMFGTTSKIELPGDTPVILPTFFCAQLIALAKAYPDADAILVLLPGALMVDFVTPKAPIVTVASLFTRTVVEVEPMDFHKIVRKHCDVAKLRANPMTKIPDSLDAAFDRALLMQSVETVKTTEVTVSKTSLHLRSSSSIGDSEDDVDYAGTTESKFLVDPALVARALKRCTRASFPAKAVLMTDDSGAFLHLIAHCSS